MKLHYYSQVLIL